MAGWRTLGLCLALAFPVGSTGLLSRRRCERREEPDWLGFQTAIKLSGLAGEDGISNLAADLRAGALSLSVPHTYAVVGGGEWGPRLVAKALLESVYVDWVNDVYVLDMGEAKAYFSRPDNGFDEAQTWFNGHLCRAIERCPRKAVVVLDNAHLLEGEEIRLLDKMLSLTDGEKSNMDCDDHKVSAERCLFLMLLNEDGPEEDKRKSGKDRLMGAWEFKGPAFTTKAFVGRIDIAVSLSETPPLVPAEAEDTWEKARIVPADDWGEIVRGRVKAAWEATDRATLQAVGVAAAATMLAACFKLGCFQAAEVNQATPTKAGEPAGAAAGGPNNANAGSGGSGGGGGGGGRNAGWLQRMRGGGSGGTRVVDVAQVAEDREKEQKKKEKEDSDTPPDGESAKEDSGSTEDEGRRPETRAPQPAVATTGTICSPANDGGADHIARRTRSSIGRANPHSGM